MSQRFFVETPITTNHVALGGAEAHHLLHVMRARVGDEVTLFDGSGHEFEARIAELKRSQVELQVLSKQAVNREAGREIVVGVALPKGDRQRWLIEKLTELGAARVVPVRCERSTVHPHPHNLNKLQRFVIEASKQSGRNQLMQISPLTEFDTFIASAPGSVVRWIADPGSELRAAALPDAEIIYVAVGPEGGFTAQECAAAAAKGWQSVSLGPRILRIETACAALVAILQ